MMTNDSNRWPKWGAFSRPWASRIACRCKPKPLSANTLRAPDAAFISKARLATITQPDKFLPFPPDLAVEVVSPGDTATEIQDKVNLYLEAGTRLVWVIYPDLRQAVVHRANRTAQTILYEGVLDGEDVLPGLSIALSDLFPQATSDSTKQG